MRPFLLLATRPDHGAAQAEYEAVRRHSGLEADELVHLRLDQTSLAEIDLREFSGIFLGGSSFNVSDTDKSDLQRRVEKDLDDVVTRVLDADLPFLGLCYGIGTLTTHLGGVVDRRYGEPVSAVEVHPTGVEDPLLEGLEDGFWAFVGHKEGCSVTPEGVTLLATADSCPVQMYRIGKVYATQFHPELDAEDFVARMTIYRTSGYFRPEELEDLSAEVRGSAADGRQHLVLTNFVKNFARS